LHAIFERSDRRKATSSESTRNESTRRIRDEEESPSGYGTRLESVRGNPSQVRVLSPPPWRVVRAVHGAGLENQWAQALTGSNPVPSAHFLHRASLSSSGYNCICCMKKSPPPNIDFELLKTFNRVESTHWWWEGRRYLLKVILENKKPKAIIDIGCGTGESLNYLQKLFPRTKLYGIDTSNEAVTYTKSRGHKNILNAKAEKVPFKNEMFDIVLLLDVLEHIKNDTQVLLEAKRIVTRNGLIIITSPALPLIWSDHDKNQGHFRRYTKKDFVKLAKKTNLHIIKNAYFNFFLSPIVILVRTLGKVSFLKSIVQYDNGINYEVARIPLINRMLTKIFKTELWFLAKGIRYPFGISLVAVLQKHT
jgi:ubiquinone/menaquinone biosynthesis C-methylase UbiE